MPKLLVPAAAGGLALTMVGAVLTHILRADPAPSIIISSLLCAMATTVAVKRYRAFSALGVLGS